MDPNRLLREAQRIGVTDFELQKAVEWALEARIQEDGAWPRLRKVLELKVEDRQLLPAARQLNETLNKLRNAIRAVDAEIPEGVAFVKDHPEITSTAAFREAWMAAHRSRAVR